jgi:hypothetical protein
MKLRLQLIFALSVSAVTFASALPTFAQDERGTPSWGKSAYGQSFFAELQRIFGRFRDADLRRVFEAAKPVRCSDLVSDTGEWRDVAFFNEYRKFGDWYRTSLDEVKDDPAVYVFKGTCAEEQSHVEVTTEFPVEQSFKEYGRGRIRFHDIHLITNPPVVAHVDNRTGAYTFDLPYLFRVSHKDTYPLYALNAPTLSDRYAPEVTNRWECKAVADENVTYQFLICHDTLVWRDAEAGSRNSGGSYGSSAFSILSDGKQASSAVKLTFGESLQVERKSEYAHSSDQLGVW